METMALTGRRARRGARQLTAVLKVQSCQSMSAPASKSMNVLWFKRLLDVRAVHEGGHLAEVGLIWREGGEPSGLRHIEVTDAGRGWHVKIEDEEEKHLGLAVSEGNELVDGGLARFQAGDASLEVDLERLERALTCNQKAMVAKLLDGLLRSSGGDELARPGE